MPPLKAPELGAMGMKAAFLVWRWVEEKCSPETDVLGGAASWAVLQALAAFMGKPGALLCGSADSAARACPYRPTRFPRSRHRIRFGEGTGELGSGEHMACLTSSFFPLQK